MTFKKDGHDPAFNRMPSLPGLPGGPSWASFVERAAEVAQEFIAAALGMTREPGQPEDYFRGRRSGRGKGHQAKPKKRRNLITHSRRVRRKHRRARRAA